MIFLIYKKVIFITEFHNKKNLINKFIFDNNSFVVEDKNEQENTNLNFANVILRPPDNIRTKLNEHEKNKKNIP